MNRLLATAALALAVGAPALAHANNGPYDNPTLFKRYDSPAAFNSAYDETLIDMIKYGIQWQHVCENGYCLDGMVHVMGNGGYIITLGNVTYANGSKLRELCTGALQQHVCTLSDGRAFAQHFDGSSWKTTQMIADHFIPQQSTESAIQGCAKVLADVSQAYGNALGQAPSQALFQRYPAALNAANAVKDQCIRSITLGTNGVDAAAETARITNWLVNSND